MKKTLISAVALVAMIGAIASQVSETTAAQQEVVNRAVVAANRYLASLNAEQTTKTAFPFDSPTKATWHNGPPNIQRAGTVFGSLSAAQRALAYSVMESVLSPAGYQKILNIMDADEEFGRGGATFPTGPNAYSVAIYGTPSLTEPWQVQVNGHHLGLNVTIIGRENVLSPTLTGALPSNFERNGKTVRTLGEETDSAFALVGMLTPEQRAKAVLPHLTGDLVLGPGQDGKVIEPEGLRASEMTAAQQAALVRVASVWINILDQRAAQAKIAEVRSDIAQTYFAWGGDTAAGSRAYFRVQGPRVFIEYGPQVNAGRGAPAGPAPAAAGPGQLASNRDPNHIHTVFRDFTNDYGKRLVR